MATVERAAELFDTADVEEFVDKVFHSCDELDCASCPRKNEIAEDACQPELITELWRRWHNAKDGGIIIHQVGNLTIN